MGMQRDPHLASHSEQDTCFGVSAHGSSRGSRCGVEMADDAEDWSPAAVADTWLAERSAPVIEGAWLHREAIHVLEAGSEPRGPTEPSRIQLVAPTGVDNPSASASSM